MKAPLRIAVCACLVVSACSSSSDNVDATETPSTLALSETTTTTTAPSTVPAPTIDYDGFDEFAGSPSADDFATTSAPTTTTPAQTIKAPPTTSGGGSPAVTQAPGSPKPPSSLYQGVLGTYSLDQVFASSPVARPVAAGGTMPLTGLAGSSPNRPAIVVKIDNASKARPHTGLNNADIVIEEEVEFGITRFAAVFHSADTTVGPVRSGRSTDISFLNGFGTPGLVYSGANKVIDQLLRNQVNVSNYSAARSSGYWRSNNRPAPHNLYTKTDSFSSVAPGGPPPAQFHYRPSGVASTQGVAHSTFGVAYPANRVRWDWNGSWYERSQGGGAHTTDGHTVTASNVVVVAVKSVGTGLFDSTGAPVPEYVFLGTGPAAVFTDGRRIDGTWTRPTLRDPAILHVDGQAITLTPGRTWIQVTTSGQYLQNG